MCDQTKLIYADGDVVWVKVESLWWPGVVKDIENDEEEKHFLDGLKKKPIAVVKFFDEENYEFVNNLDRIYHYNCRMKDEFIKKGLDKHRAGASKLAKFPSDVSKAEGLVKGDVNITNDPKFAPAEKSNYSELFGTPKKKIKKLNEETPRLRKVLVKKRYSAPTPYSGIDPNAHKLAARSPLVSEGAIYSCKFCSFTSGRVENISSHVIFLHTPGTQVNFSPAGCSSVKKNRSFSDVKRVRAKALPATKKRGRPAKVVKTTSQTSEEVKVKAKSPVKRVNQSASTEKSSEKKKRFTDVLLADWSEDDDIIENETKLSTGLDESGGSDIKIDEPVEGLTESVKENESVETTEIVKTKEIVTETSVAADEPSFSVKKDTTSCFDFDEEEEGFIGMSDAQTYGRKIPRVIPAKDKTDLGMDLEIDKLFKTKSESECEDNVDKVEVKVTRRRGRPPKQKATTVAEPRSSSPESPVKGEALEAEAEPEPEPESENEPLAETKASPSTDPQETEKLLPIATRRSGSTESPEKKKSVPAAAEMLASTRSRRPGARKSYLKGVIEKVDDEGNIVHEPEADDTPKVSSRRKQDLKKQSLMELDDFDLIKFKEREEAAKLLRKKKAAEAASEDFTSKVDSLLAETITPELPSVPKTVRTQLLHTPCLEPLSLERENAVESLISKKEGDVKPATAVDLSNIIEYLEEMTPSTEIVVASPEPVLLESSPVKSKEDIVNVSSLVTKSAIPQWKQDISEALKASRDVAPPKDIIVGGTSSPVVTDSSPKVIAVKGQAKYLVVKRPNIFGKSQSVMVVNNSRTVQKSANNSFSLSPGMKVVATSKPSSGTGTQSVVQIIRDGSGGIKRVFSRQKLVQIEGKAYSSRIVVKNSSNGSEGIRLIENFNGSGKTAIIQQKAGTSSGIKSSTVGKTLGLDGETRKSVFRQVKGPDGKITYQEIKPGMMRISSGGASYVLPQQKYQQTLKRVETQTVKKIEAPFPKIVNIVPERVVEKRVVEVRKQPAPVDLKPVVPTQEVVAMPGPVGEDGQPTYFLVTVDENGEMKEVENSMISYDSQSDNGVVLMNPSEGLQPAYTSSQDILAEALANTNVLESETTIPTLMLGHLGSGELAPLLAPLVVPDPSHLIAPIVHETSVTLQKPIMTPIEMPTSIIPDTSGLQPPPLPPTPTDDVLMDDVDSGLTIAEEQEIPVGQSIVAQVHPEGNVQQAEGDFFIDDSQEGEEVNSFQSMPLLNEESTASEEPIGDQNFEIQQGARVESEFLPTSTNPELEPQQQEVVVEHEELVALPPEVEEGKEEKDGVVEDGETRVLPFINEEGFTVEADSHPSQETEVSSTTGDSKDSVP